MKKQRIFIFISYLSVALALLIVSAPLAWAQDSQASCGQGQMRLNVPLGGTNCVEISSAFSSYLGLWYGFLIGSVGIFATVMIMWGGFKWLVSRGNSSEITAAKEIIWNSIIGLLLTFLSYTLISLINPRLTIIKLPELSYNIGQNTASTDTGDEYDDGASAGATNPTEVKLPGGFTKTMTIDQKKQFLAQNGIATSGVSDQGLEGMSDQVFAQLISLQQSHFGNDKLTITSAWRPSGANHNRGNTYDLRTDQGGSIDQKMIQLLGGATGTPDSRNPNRIIYRVKGLNQYNITRMIDERKTSKPHWHVEIFGDQFGNPP